MCGTESSSGMEHPVEYGVIGMPMKAVEEESNHKLFLVNLQMNVTDVYAQ